MGRSTLKTLLWITLSFSITCFSVHSRAAVGDKYWCRSELYAEVKSDGTFRQISAGFFLYFLGQTKK